MKLRFIESAQDRKQTVVMTQSFESTRIFYIFRSTQEQVKLIIKDDGFLTSSHRLYEYEKEYLRKHYEHFKY